MNMNYYYTDSNENESKFKEKMLLNKSNNALNRDKLMRDIWLDPETWNTLLYENIKLFVSKVRKLLEC